jgi:hypothetical protein
VHEFAAEKPISWVKPAHFDFLAIIFIVLSHILCIGVDALICDKVLVHKLILLLTHSWLWHWLCIISLWGNVLVVGYLLSIRGLAWLGADRGKETLTPKSKKDVCSITRIK